MKEPWGSCKFRLVSAAIPCLALVQVHSLLSGLRCRLFTLTSSLDSQMPHSFQISPSPGVNHTQMCSRCFSDQKLFYIILSTSMLNTRLQASDNSTLCSHCLLPWLLCHDGQNLRTMNQSESFIPWVITAIEMELRHVSFIFPLSLEIWWLRWQVRTHIYDIICDICDVARILFPQMRHVGGTSAQRQIISFLE